ncbi:hypothetical protein F0562_015616 [Nyssa sinensis]|uniref:Bet v I/Major latex protein domain-containing protein n=1 Tax=Nyssa sinensis TaxID=561372 RepID=A0A5J4ZKU8_9ASTE|nr:hypothetical protein F0562_015616 [Nyssa sinensis]
MGVIAYDMEITSSIAPAKMFKAFVLDSDDLIPKILPQAIKSAEIIEGEGGAGTIKLITFGKGSQFKSESISYEIKIQTTPNGGSICKNNSKNHTKGDAQITEDQIKDGKDKAAGMFKAVEAYLLANPDAYN